MKSLLSALRIAEAVPLIVKVRSFSPQKSTLSGGCVRLSDSLSLNEYLIRLYVL